MWTEGEVGGCAVHLCLRDSRPLLIRASGRPSHGSLVDSNHLAPYAQSGGVRDKMTSSPSSAVPTCVMRERHVQCGARDVRTRWVANL